MKRYRVTFGAVVSVRDTRMTTATAVQKLTETLDKQGSLLGVYVCLQQVDWTQIETGVCLKIDALNRAWRIPEGFGGSMYGVLPVFVSEVIQIGNEAALKLLLRFQTTVQDLPRTSALVSALSSGNVEVVELVIKHWFTGFVPLDPVSWSADLAQCIRIARVASMTMFRFLSTHRFFESVQCGQYIGACCYRLDELELSLDRAAVMKHVIWSFPLVVARYLQNEFSPHDTIQALAYLRYSTPGPPLNLSFEHIGHRLFLQAILLDDVAAAEWYILETDALTKLSTAGWQTAALAARSVQMCALLLVYAPEYGIHDLGSFTTERLEDLVRRGNPNSFPEVLERCARAQWSPQVEVLVASLCTTGTAQEQQQLRRRRKPMRTKADSPQQQPKRQKLVQSSAETGQKD